MRKNKSMQDLVGIKGNWNEVKGKLKQSFALINENHLLFGRQDEMLDRIQKKLGKTKEEIYHILYKI